MRASLWAADCSLNQRFDINAPPLQHQALAGLIHRLGGLGARGGIGCLQNQLNQLLSRDSSTIKPTALIAGCRAEAAPFWASRTAWGVRPGRRVRPGPGPTRLAP